MHARAILGIPIKNIKMHKNGASAVILADKLIEKTPLYEGIKEAVNLNKPILKFLVNLLLDRLEEWVLFYLMDPYLLKN